MIGICTEKLHLVYRLSGMLFSKRKYLRKVNHFGFNVVVIIAIKISENHLFCLSFVLKLYKGVLTAVIVT